MSTTNTYTLSDAVELYFAGDTRPKNFKSAMIVAKFVWNEILRGTIWACESVRLPVYSSTPYRHMKLPDNIERVLNVFDSETCGDQTINKPLGRINNVNVVREVTQHCKCKENCGCGEACANINAYTHTTIEHIIRGETYIEKVWTEVCKNGDIIEWREVPTEKYVGTDFDSVVYEKQRNVVCKVEVKECGCLVENETNLALVENYCGRCAPVCAAPYHSHCKTFFQLDKCDTVYLIGSDIKKDYLVQYQSKGACEESRVPEYALSCLHLGMFYKMIYIKPGVSPGEKREAKYAYKDAKNSIIEYLNPIDLKLMDDIHHG